MKKKIQKPFDVEAAKNGATVKTKGGKSVRIVCYDRISSYPILALVFDGKAETCYHYKLDGSLGYYAGITNSEDLVIIEEVDCPKFNVGDWVFMNTHGSQPWLVRSQPWLVIKVTPNYYEIKDSSGYITAKSHHTIDSLFHPWTLKDAKPGNILVSTDNCHPFIFKGLYYDGASTAYCGIDTTDSIYISDGDLPWTRDTVRPATYKERRQFFDRLKEEGYKWDSESFTLSKIQKKWRDNEKNTISGYYTHSDSRITYSKDHNNTKENYNIFATEKQAKSALAMARISQIMTNDKRFGGIVTDEEWTGKSWYSIIRINNDLRTATRFCYELLAFHTKKQADLFLEENRDLVKDYYMMD